MENSNVNPVSDTPIQYIPTPEHIPVTENEMSEFQQSASAFFGRIVSTVVSMSEQAQELKKLREDVQAATDKLNALLEDNARKAEEIQGLRETNAWLGRTSQANAEKADKAEKALGDEMAYSKALAEDHAVVVAKLTTSIEQERLANHEYHERAHDAINAANTRNQELAQRVRDLEAECATGQRDAQRLLGERDEAWARFENVQAERDAIRDKLAAVQQALSGSAQALRAVS